MPIISKGFATGYLVGYSDGSRSVSQGSNPKLMDFPICKVFECIKNETISSICGNGTKTHVHALRYYIGRLKLIDIEDHSILVIEKIHSLSTEKLCSIVEAAGLNYNKPAKKQMKPKSSKFEINFTLEQVYELIKNSKSDSEAASYLAISSKSQLNNKLKEKFGSDLNDFKSKLFSALEERYSSHKASLLQV